jgi:hypothetical protein
VKTRTLLLLSALCAAAILGAGIALLWRVNDPPVSQPALTVGQSGTAGDATITVHAVSAVESRLLVDVSIGGVDDADGLDGFALLQPGGVTDVDRGASTCEQLRVEAVRCQLAFELLPSESDVRQLLFRRADEQLRWDLKHDGQ